jgi:hypothetical protein
MFDQFHLNLNHLEHLLSYFITLIPKVLSSHSLGEFLLISLFGSLYEFFFLKASDNNCFTCFKESLVGWIFVSRKMWLFEGEGV